jgi:ATP-dependent DNA helicase 2 subunit 2
MPIEDTYSPVLHRINQAIRRRAVRPEEPVQPPADILIEYSHPPEDLVKKSEAQLSKLIAVANVKKGKDHPDTNHKLLILSSAF